jgi:hypothetical protein
VSYKRTGIARFTRILAKRHLPGRERTNGTEPGLENHNSNPGEMRDTKPWIPHPSPRAKLTNENKDQAEDNESDKERMCKEDGVCCNEIKHAIFHGVA